MDKRLFLMHMGKRTHYGIEHSHRFEFIVCCQFQSIDKYQ